MEALGGMKKSGRPPIHLPSSQMELKDGSNSEGRIFSSYE